MYRKSRLDEILEIMKKNGYVTVKFLTDRLHYSTATINRDLNLLEKQKLITRSYGGAELKKSSSIPLAMRYHKAHAAKNKVAKKAAELVNDGDTVFIDGTSTTQYMGQYLTEHKNLTVITNNLALATFLSDHGIRIIVIGGEIVESPSIVGGPVAAENVMHYRADKMFFSVSAILSDGALMADLHNPMLSVMLKCSKEKYLLTDKTKLDDEKCKEVITTIDKINGVISDCDFKSKFGAEHPATVFYDV